MQKPSQEKNNQATFASILNGISWLIPIIVPLPESLWNWTVASGRIQVDMCSAAGDKQLRPREIRYSPETSDRTNWTHLKATAKAWWELKMTESEPGEKKWKRMECKKQPGNPKQDQRIQAPHSVFLSSRDVRAWFVTELLAPHERNAAWLRTNCSVETETLKGVWAFGRCNAKVTRICLFGARELSLSIIHCGNPWRAVPGSSRGGTRIRKASCSVLEKRPEGREGKWMQNNAKQPA